MSKRGRPISAYRFADGTRDCLCIKDTVLIGFVKPIRFAQAARYADDPAAVK